MHLLCPRLIIPVPCQHSLSIPVSLARSPSLSVLIPPPAKTSDGWIPEPINDIKRRNQGAGRISERRQGIKGKGMGRLVEGKGKRAKDRDPIDQD